MKIHTLPSLVTKEKRRLGQGHGSGRVKTSGRGTKGQKARRDISLTFEGGALPLIKRLPFRRGKGRNNSFKEKPVIINLSSLNVLPKDVTIDIATLIKYNLVNEKEIKHSGVKVLGTGPLETPFTFKVPASRAAIAVIEKIGGHVEQS